MSSCLQVLKVFNNKEMSLSKSSIKVFAPASISNVGPGFDVLGFAIEGMGDIITLSTRNDAQYVIESVGTDLPMNPEKNIATIALKSFCDALGYKGGFDIRIEKNFKPGSGLGSSASSAVGAVFAANELLQAKLSKDELIKHALDGETVASGNRHGDNIVPCMLGGFMAIKSCDPFEGFDIPYPENLKVLVIFPDVPIKTSEARQILPNQISMQVGIRQSANMAGLIKGLIQSDYELIKSSLKDSFAQPYRKKLIPIYQEIEHKVMSSGAFGFNISGSGPTMFAFFKEGHPLEGLKKNILRLYQEKGIEVQFHESSVNKNGVELI